MPDVITVPAAFGSLSSQLILAFASPSGPALQQLLAPYLGGTSGPLLVSSQSQSTVTVEPPEHFESGEYQVGPDKMYSGWVPFMMSVDVTNTRTDIVTHEVYQSQQSLDAIAASYLLGDLYAAVPTILLDGDAAFIDALLGHAHVSTGGAIIPAGTPPLALAAAPLTAPAVDAVAFAAAGSPNLFVAPDWHAWLDGAVSYSTLASTAEHLGLTFTGTEMALGAAYQQGPWRAGGSAAFGKTTFTQQASGDSGMVTSLRAGGFLGMDTGDWSITGSFAGGYHWMQANRLSGLPSGPAAAFAGSSFSAGLEASRRFTLWEIEVEPLAGAVASIANAVGFTEAGASGLELVVEPTSTRSLDLYAGGRLSGRYALGELLIRPELQFRVHYEVLGDQRIVVSSFANNPGAGQVSVAGLQPGRFAARLAAGIIIEFAERWRGGIAGELQYRDGNPAYRLQVSASAAW